MNDFITKDVTIERTLLREDILNVLQCPSCKSFPLDAKTQEDEIICPSCNAAYPINTEEGWCSFLPRESDTDVKANIQAWWGDLYKQL